MSTSLTPQSSIQTPVSESSDLSDLLQETLALTQRLFIQLQRRPTTLVAGIIQPVMWLVLFGALFQNAPQNFFGDDISYGQFFCAGMIVFTAFSGALNAGLPVMFDREFGFLNRLLVAPLVSRFSIVLASALYIMALTLVQTVVIVAMSAFLGAGLPSAGGLVLMGLVIVLMVLAVTALSLGLAFSLPGHIELIGVIFVTNLPLLFASTALAPLSFMPHWLQWVASLNPLTFAIEPIRHIYLHATWSLSDVVMQAPFGTVTLGSSLLALVGFCATAILLIQPALKRTLI